MLLELVGAGVCADGAICAALLPPAGMLGPWPPQRG